MSDNQNTNSPNLSLSYLAAGQAQKHVTMNESLRNLDALVMLVLKSCTLATPPISPQEGERYAIPTSPNGVWSGKTGKIAAYQDGGWLYYLPKEGWTAWEIASNQLKVFQAGVWVNASEPTQTIDMLGVNCTADANNRLSVASSSSLFSHNGDDHRIKINKSLEIDTASIVFQSGWSGRAEMGLNGADAFSFKVSADGASWKTALFIDSTGKIGINDVTQPSVALQVDGALRLRAYTLANVPSANGAGEGSLAYISDAAGGAVMVFSDGTNWRRVTDRTILN